MSNSFRVLNPHQKRPRRTAPVAKPRVSRYELDGHRIAYDANSMVAVEIFSDELWLKIGGFVARGVHAMGPLFTRQAPQFDFPPTLLKRHVVLNLTHACNLNCRYCFVEGPRTARMSLLTAKAALRWLAPVSHIAFFGGEPMLEFDTIRQIVEANAVSRDGPPPHYHITTNATLIDPPKANFLAKHHFSAIVSIDGPKELHDANRPTRKGLGSYTDTLTGLLCMADAGIKPTLRATCLTPDQLLPAAQHLNELLADGLGSHVSVEPADVSEGCAHSQGERIEPRQWREAYQGLARWIAQEARQGRPAQVHQIDTLRQRLTDRTPAPSECGAGKNYLGVSPDGAIHACHRERSPIGTAAGGLDELQRTPWQDNRYYARADCPSCPIRNACGGGCRWVSHTRGDIRQPADCHFRKQWFEAALWLLCELPSAPKNRPLDPPSTPVRSPMEATVKPD